METSHPCDSDGQNAVMLNELVTLLLQYGQSPKQRNQVFHGDSCVLIVRSCGNCLDLGELLPRRSPQEFAKKRPQMLPFPAIFIVNFQHKRNTIRHAESCPSTRCDVL